jgi:hypothetical protein
MEGGAPLAPVDPLAFPALGGFKISGMDFLAKVFGGLSTFGTHL